MPGDLEKGSIEATSPQQALGTVPVPAPPMTQPRAPASANPATLGLFSFASTTFILSMFNCTVRSIHHPNVVVGMAVFCGGLAQILAGMWEFPTGNAFGAAAFTSYGAFWMSYATILLPGSGIVAAYEGNAAELRSALGIFLLAWTLVTIFFFIISLNKNYAFMILFGFLTLTFACLAGGELGASPSSTKAGGILGVMTAFIAYYVGIAYLLEGEPHPLFTLPLGHLHPHAKRPKKQ